VASSRSSSASSSAEAWGRVADAILESEGVVPAYVRRAIARGEDPPEYTALLDKVRREAYRIVDADVAGFDADTVYELTLAAALAEADRRRLAALEAIG
jgi:sirohydrochlorin ferrochelatase